MKVEIKCPVCRGKMLHRQNKKNGNEFYGCGNFPNCKFTMSLEQYRRAKHERGCQIIGEHPDDMVEWYDNPGDW